MDRYQVITSLSHADYRDLVRGITKEVWPEFMLHDPVANELWHELLDRFAGYQFALYDTQEKRAAGMGNSFPLRWDGPLEGLPEEGWDWAFREAVEGHRKGIPPNLHCAIQIVVRPDYRGQGLSAPMVQAVRAVTKHRRLQSLIIPLRPSEKSKYPLTSLDDYITWTSEDGLPLDAWLRVHVKLGARIIKVCHTSKTIRGTPAEWEKWTSMKFLQSGSYTIPGALSPVEMDLDANDGNYIEPNVWIVHRT
jgi:GNAT superfamily N-acetyltransferase